MTTLAPAALKGSFPPLVTPFSSDGAVDFDRFAALVERQASAGSAGVVVTGTTGEPALLSVEERIALYQVAVDAAAGRLQVVAATGSQSHAETVRLTEAADRCGADALLIVTPYFTRPPQRGLVEYYRDLCGRTERPVMVYHIPGRSGVEVAPETLAAVAGTHPNLVGVKHAANDLGWVTDVLRLLGREFRIHVGLEELSFPMLALGAHGLMNAVGNIAPAAVAELYERCANGDLAGAREAHFALADLNKAVFFDTNPIPIKYMMYRMDLLPAATHRSPMVPATAALQERLDAVLLSAGLLPERSRAA